MLGATWLHALRLRFIHLYAFCLRLISGELQPADRMKSNGHVFSRLGEQARRLDEHYEAGAFVGDAGLTRLMGRPGSEGSGDGSEESEGDDVLVASSCRRTNYYARVCVCVCVPPWTKGLTPPLSHRQGGSGPFSSHCLTKTLLIGCDMTLGRQSHVPAK